MLSIDLPQQLAALQEQELWQHGDRNVYTLIEEPGLQITLHVFRPGARRSEYQSGRWVTLQALAGCLRIDSPEETIDLPAGHLVLLRPGVQHDVEALQLSAVLLTIT
jgi:quercetin dioxygenase-like cupin family protein